MRVMALVYQIIQSRLKGIRNPVCDSTLALHLFQCETSVFVGIPFFKRFRQRGNIPARRVTNVLFQREKIILVRVATSEDRCRVGSVCQFWFICCHPLLLDDCKSLLYIS